MKNTDKNIGNGEKTLLFIIVALSLGLMVYACFVAEHFIAKYW